MVRVTLSYSPGASVAPLTARSAFGVVLGEPATTVVAGVTVAEEFESERPDTVAVYGPEPPSTWKLQTPVGTSRWMLGALIPSVVLGPVRVVSTAGHAGSTSVSSQVVVLVARVLCRSPSYDVAPSFALSG